MSRPYSSIMKWEALPRVLNCFRNKALGDQELLSSMSFDIL
jgi:hypothetical protein